MRRHSAAHHGSDRRKAHAGAGDAAASYIRARNRPTWQGRACLYDEQRGHRDATKIKIDIDREGAGTATTGTALLVRPL